MRDVSRTHRLSLVIAHRSATRWEFISSKRFSLLANILVITLKQVTIDVGCDVCQTDRIAIYEVGLLADFLIVSRIYFNERFICLKLCSGLIYI